MLSGLRLFFRKPRWYVGKKIIYRKDAAWHDNAEVAYSQYRCKLRATREGWVGKIVHCTQNRFKVQYDNGVEQTYSLDAILDSDLAYIRRFDGKPWS
jgi:hypothetical protein